MYNNGFKVVKSTWPENKCYQFTYHLVNPKNSLFPIRQFWMIVDRFLRVGSCRKVKFAQRFGQVLAVLVKIKLAWVDQTGNACTFVFDSLAWIFWKLVSDGRTGNTACVLLSCSSHSNVDEMRWSIWWGCMDYSHARCLLGRWDNVERVESWNDRKASDVYSFWKRKNFPADCRCNRSYFGIESANS